MRNRTTQRQQILQLLQEREGQWVPLYEILPLAAQYSARIHELRTEGYEIKNRIEHRNGVVHSWFMLVIPKEQGKLFEVEPEAERQREHVLEIQRTSL